MDEGNQQSTSPQQYSADPRLAHQKVLQPDASFAAEVKAAQQPATNPARPAPQSEPQTTQPVSTQAQRPAATANSIYPEPTVDIGIPAAISSAAPENEQAAVNNAGKAKVIAVRAVAALLVISNVINAHNWYIEQRAGYTSWISIIGIGIGFVLAVGIFLLNEVSRSIYVILSTLMLVLTGFSLLMFYISISHSSSAISNATYTYSKSDLQKSIDNARKNPTLTPAQKQEIINTLQNQMNTAPSTPGSSSFNVQQYFSSGLLLVTSLFPLVFFTRPAIKQVFS